MAAGPGPDETGRSGPAVGPKPSVQDGDLDSRRRELERALAARRAAEAVDEGKAKTGGMAGYGYAMRLSSEFIAAIVVGGALGWLIDMGLGSSPWGLVVFLLLGFCAGILNVLRAAGLIAEFGLKKPKG